MHGAAVLAFQGLQFRVSEYRVCIGLVPGLWGLGSRCLRPMTAASAIYGGSTK